MSYLQPSREQGRDLVMRGIDGPVHMLNLIRLREIADYSATPELAPRAPVTGREAYDLYVRHTLPHLQAAGGSLELLGEGGSFFIGPPDERWDLVMLVRQASVEAFLSHARNEAIARGIGHRTAAVEDARLLPLVAREPDR